MFDKPFRLQIITPTRVVFQDGALSVTAPGVLGGFQVLYDHAPLLSALEVGEIKVKKTDGGELHFATSGGFLEVKQNEVVILADSAELAADIDKVRADRAHERARSRLHSKDPAIDPERARHALLRAQNRLRIAGR
jgi:F-type H+-transporting ATPase subunit epsilon